MQSMEEVRHGFYINQWLVNALENLADSVARLFRLTKGRSWLQMPKVLHKDEQW